MKYNSKNSYAIYKTVSSNPVDVRKYLIIVNLFMKFLAKKLITTGSILLPEKLGNVQVIGKKVKIKVEDGEIKGLAPDWVKTKELWKQDEEAKINKKLVYHFNEDTNGIRYRFFWSRNRVVVLNKTLYDLKMTRENKRNLVKEIKNNREYLIK